MAKKPFFHEIPQSEVDTLIKEGVTWGQVKKDYQKPKWCKDKYALIGVMGCWSLCDLAPDGRRTKISVEFCKDCDYFKS
jgi:hypothetical protein